MPSPLIVAFHILVAISLFFTINWVGRHSKLFGYLSLGVVPKADEAPAFNAIFRVISPVVGIVLVAAALYALNAPHLVEGIWLVAAYYVSSRLLFNVAMGRGRLINWPFQLILDVAIVAVSYGVYRGVITNRANLLPDPSTMANELWILIVLFLYKVTNGVSLPTAGTERRKLKYLQRRYSYLRQRYGDIVSGVEPHELRALIYSIMIYETFNRPWLARQLESSVLFPLGLSKTLGPMQVTTEKRLSDRESVAAGVSKLERDFETEYAQAYEQVALIRQMTPEYIPSIHGEHSTKARQAAIRPTAASYNRDDDYVQQVMDIFHELEKMTREESPEPVAAGK